MQNVNKDISKDIKGAQSSKAGTETSLKIDTFPRAHVFGIIFSISCLFCPTPHRGSDDPDFL
jgi:hypothetical protein